jgi:hypothetical protein
LEHLTKYLKNYVADNPDGSKDIGTNLILRTQRDCAASKTTLELLYQINCSGNDEIPVSSFILFAQKDKVVGSGSRRSSSDQTKRKLRFSFFEVEYQNEHSVCKEFITVRLMAILKFSTYRYADHRITKIHFMAFVLRMKPVQGLVHYGPYVNLQHNVFGSRNQYLALDIINFSAFHMPACVFQTPHLDISSSELDTLASAYNKDNTFYQIPSSRIVSLTAVHSYSSLNGHSMSSEFLDQAALQDILNSYKEKKTIGESEVEEGNLKCSCEDEEEHEPDDLKEPDDSSIGSHCDSHDEF